MAIKSGDQVIAYNNSVEAYLKDEYGNVNTSKKALTTYGIFLKEGPEVRIWNAGELMGIYTGNAVSVGGVNYLEFTYKCVLRSLKTTFFGTKTQLEDIEMKAYVPSQRVVNNPLEALDPESKTAGEKNLGSNDNKVDNKETDPLVGLKKLGTSSLGNNTTIIIVAAVLVTISIILAAFSVQNKNKSKNNGSSKR